ncbi:MAG: phosphoenolpyruvate carboxykinase (ATP), partial [Halobacteriovoraceae bacterium]|nr:phosphoenolpyruvate carboxykinase (ATP) [Halobacteriovoraceae bacterium]
GQYIDKYQIPVWLINTGWGGGPYGVGERYPIPFTREIIRSIQNEQVDEDKLKQEPFFGLAIPEKLSNFSSDKLNAKSSWKNQMEYEKNALSLAKSFHRQMEKFEEFYRTNKEGGPPNYRHNQSN